MNGDIMFKDHETVVYSDHKNLTYFCNLQKVNRRQAGWSLELSEYNLKLVHLPGARMVQSDALSCCPDFYLNEDDDNTNITLLLDNLFVNLIDLDLQRRIAESDSYDSSVADAIKLLLSDGPSAAKSDLSDWTIDHVCKGTLRAAFRDFPIHSCKSSSLNQLAVRLPTSSDALPTAVLLPQVLLTE